MNKVLGCNNLMANMDVATVIFVLLIMIIFPVKTSATDYIVGDDKGWTIFYNYTNWVKDKNFYIGDAIECMLTTYTLNGVVFKYTAGYHNVAKVNETAFRNCDNSSAGPILYTGNDRIVYGTPGNVWYICGLAKNCEGGQKLAITIQPTPPPSPPFPPPAAAPAHPAPFLPPPSRPSGGLSSKALTGIIVGITVGAIFLVIIGVGIVICYKKKRNKYQKQSLLGSQTPQTSKVGTKNQKIKIMSLKKKTAPNFTISLVLPFIVKLSNNIPPNQL
ncbi:blue copper protein 1b-like [Mercurialis annua]|uniref:blue copper protein 1b-like n=1 Tax=Mercurialis annua TaxID=3986 RepID=UPI0024AEA80F|nr:blue copper protein 1b-like [Mercurialis annua]